MPFYSCSQLSCGITQDSFMNASNSNQVKGESDNKFCKVCGESIKRSAIKCIHCESFQDFRRFLTFSNTMLALIIALISVIAAVSPIIKDIFVEKNSNILVKLQYVDRESIYLVASNLGERDGSIGKTIMEIQTKNGKGYRSLLEKKRQESFINANSSEQVRLYLGCQYVETIRNAYFHFKQQQLSPQGVLVFEIISFKGERKNQRIELERISLESFFNSSWKKCKK